MRHTVALVILLVFLLTACGEPARDLASKTAAAPVWPSVDTVASYDMDVSLDVENKSLTGHERITYVNTGEEPIPDVVFHLYLNAFRDNHSSLFMQEAGPEHRGYSLDEAHPGWIEVTSIRLEDGTPLSFELIEDQTLGRFELPDPVAPGKTLTLDIDFEAQLPKVFARTGFYEDFFMVAQWFPKLGVWQNDRWNAYPFHANSEFFADFGDYDVRVTAPAQYVIAASGLPVSSQVNADETRTTQFEAKGVIDFAWSASPHFRQLTRVVNGTEIVYVYLPEHEFTIERVLYAAEAAVINFDDWYGTYPYPRLTIVDVPERAGGAGGMEYPMLVAAGLEDLTGLGLMEGKFDRWLEAVTIHEIAHQWWYAVVAFNEAEEPWLDEGFTDYSTGRLMEKLYGSNDTIQFGGIRLSYLQMRRMDYLLYAALPMYGNSWDFDPIGYGVATYAKPLLSLTTLENMLGEELMLEIMSTFFEKYKFSHPGTEDFHSVAEEVADQNLDWFFDGLVYGDGVLNYAVTEVEEHSLTVERQGELVVPTEVEVTFEDGSTEVVPWDGVQDEMIFEYPDRAPVRQAQIDPQQKIRVDLKWSDNGLSRRTDVVSWLTVSARILYQIQDLLLGQGGL